MSNDIDKGHVCGMNGFDPMTDVCIPCVNARRDGVTVTLAMVQAGSKAAEEAKGLKVFAAVFKAMLAASPDTEEHQVSKYKYTPLLEEIVIAIAHPDDNDYYSVVVSQGLLRRASMAIRGLPVDASPIPEGNTSTVVDKDAVIAKQAAAIEVLRHTVMEVRHAQNVGAEWYTRGAGGLYQQVRLWLDKADAALLHTTEGEG